MTRHDCFELPIDGAGAAVVLGDPAMPEDAKRALAEVLRAAADQMRGNLETRSSRHDRSDASAVRVRRSRP